MSALPPKELAPRVRVHHLARVAVVREDGVDALAGEHGRDAVQRLAAVDNEAARRALARQVPAFGCVQLPLRFYPQYTP